MVEKTKTLPEFTPTLVGFRAEEFLTLTETLLAIPIEQDLSEATPFRLEAPEALPEPPLRPLPPRWYPRPAPDVIEAARARLVPPPRPAIMEGRSSELERVLRPLLSGHPMFIRGEAGIGKTTLLAAIAGHERTRQRFRRIWWIDHPARLEQTLALTLNLPHVLAERDPAAQRALLASHLDDNTLLIIDNAAPNDLSLAALSAHILIAVETPPEILDPEEPLPEDPENVVTLRALNDTAATDALAHYARIEDTRKVRGDLLRIAHILGNHPYALMLAGKLISRDGLPLNEVEQILALEHSEEAETEENPENLSLNRALDVSVSALPVDYRALFEAFGAFPPGGVLFDALFTASKIGSTLACRRGLITLAEYGFVRADHRDSDHYTMFPAAYARAAEQFSPKSALGKRVATWALKYAKTHAENPPALYRAESELRFVLEQAAAPGDALLDTLRAYLRDYAPAALGDDPTLSLPEITGSRAEATNLTHYGLELTDQGAAYAAAEALQRALEIRQAHDSPHAIAETLVALARLYDANERYGQAAELLIEAAEMVYNLGAEDSLSVVRHGLARVYRHMGRLTDALDVLDDTSEAHLERAAILRAQGNYPAAIAEILRADDATPYARAELYLLSGRYAEALAEIDTLEDSASAHLRAHIYHMQGSVEEAIRGYEMALDCCAENAPTRAKVLRGLGSALASAGQYNAARDAFEAALDLQKAEEAPDPLRLGRTLRLLAALYLAMGDDQRAAETAREAISQIQQVRAPNDSADAYRTLGRALWEQNDYEGALAAFQGEAEFAQSLPDRDENRIGIALHHVAEAYRRTGSLDRAVANCRRALTHKNPVTDPYNYFITQLALHCALMQQERSSAAMDVSQEMLDHLTKSPRPDLAQYGYAQALRARTEQAMQRPIRAGQSVQEWIRMLTARSAEALEDPRPGLSVLLLGLAARGLLAEDRPTLALESAEPALELTREHYPGTLAFWAAARDLGEVYLALDRPEEAIATLELLFTDEVHSQPATYARAHEQTARAYHQLENLPAALEHLNIALEYEPEPYLKAVIQEMIGDVQLEIGQPGEAVESYRAALPNIPRDQHADVTARILTTLAHTLGGLNRYAEAIGVYEEALTVLRDVEGVSPTHTADVLRSLGQTHEAQGQLPEAGRAYRRALNVLEKVDAPRQVRDLLHLLARATASLGDQSAVQLYEQTRDATRDYGDHQELGEVLRELGDVHRDAGRLNPAIQNYQAALEYQSAQFFARDRAMTLRNMGRAYAQLEKYEEARAAWTEALELSHELEDQSPLEMALTHHAIAEAYRVQEHYSESEMSYREALRHHAAGTVAAAATWRALGQALHAAGRFDEAIEPLHNALEAEKSQPQQANARLVQTLNLMAAVHEARGDLPNAIARYHEALVYMDRQLQAVAYADTLRTLGRLYGENKQYDQACIALNDALEIEGDHVPRSDDRISATLQMIADTYRAAGDLEKAAEYYQKVTVYANLVRRASQDLRDTLNELERRRATLQAAQQSLALFDRSGDTSVKDLAFIYALIALSHANLSQPRESADTINELLNVLEARNDELNPDAADPDQRALAWLVMSRRAQDEDNLPAAQQACQAARKAVQNVNLRWVIEQVARSLED